MKIAVTGANGFVGRAVVVKLRREGTITVPLVRRSIANDEISVGEIGPFTDWTTGLRGVDCVIHSAARVHMMDGSGPETLEAYRQVNAIGTRRLAEQAAAAGVRRLVFVSTVKVNGERTLPGTIFRGEDSPAPEDAYGLSKLEGEQALKEVAARAGLEYTIVRPVLVYGPGVKANFAELIRAVKSGIPLPFAWLNNRRSLVGLDNLVDFLVCCARHPAAPGHTFMVSDGRDLSTADMVRELAQAAKRPARLFPVPASWLRMGGKMVGRGPAVARLTESLQVDIAPARRILGWNPKVSVEEGFARAVAG